MKNKKVLAKVNIVLIVFVLFSSIGYAFFKETLTINGVASTVQFYDGTKLPVTPVTRDIPNAKYFTTTLDDSQIAAFESETWEDDTYTVVLDKRIMSVMEGQSVDFVVSFTNPTTLHYTRGLNEPIAIQTPLAEGQTATDVTEVKATTSLNDVPPEGRVDITVSVKIDNFDLTHDTVIKSVVNYKLQNKYKYFYIVIKYQSTPAYVNLFDEESLVQNTMVTKEEKGYRVKAYPAVYNNTNNVVKNLKIKLKPGVEYELITNYDGTEDGATGTVQLVENPNGGKPIYVYHDTKIGIGTKINKFTLTSEQINKINNVYVYGPHPNKDVNGGLFRYIIIREANYRTAQTAN